MDAAKRHKAEIPSVRLADLYSMPFDKEIDILVEDVVNKDLGLDIKSVLGIELVGPCQALDVKDPRSKDLHTWYRDSPSEVPIMVVHNKPLDHGKYRNAGDTVFAMLLAECDHCEDRRAGKALKAQLKSLAEQKGIDLSLNKSKRKRDLEINGSTFSNLGIRVPYDEASKVGYRPLSVSAKKLRGILNKILKQHNEVVWYTVIDVNTGILCGLDLYAFGLLFKTDAENLLVPTYTLLERDLYADIIKRFTSLRGREWKNAEELLHLERKDDVGGDYCNKETKKDAAADCQC